MKAAVLHTLGQPPRYDDFADPQAIEAEVVVRIKAASLKNVDKMMANGSHYNQLPDLPCVCGVDGVGVMDDGTRLYCGGARAPFGMMAERTVVSPVWCFPVPEQLDDVTAAALPNPALSAWLSLVWRAQLRPGETALILGATGVAGQLAVQIARHLGAERVVAAGRNRRILSTLHDLGADATIALDLDDQELTDTFIREAGARRFDVVLDYVWGHPTEVLLDAFTRHDVKIGAARTRLVEIGEMAGPTIVLSAAALRSSGLELYGSGGGSVPHEAILDAFPRMWGLAIGGKLRIKTEPVPLADVEDAWQRKDLDGLRLVMVP
jgi:NADPH:quinone reductase-like Zn-dependent oxidoreductase